MGPRLQERGVLQKDAFILLMEELQWGRAYKSAEFRIPTHQISLQSRRLQWGRAYKSAELRRGKLR